MGDESDDNVIKLPVKKSKVGKRRDCRNDKLTIKQRAYAEGLAAGKHYIQACKDAGYESVNMNELTFSKMALNIKAHPKVKQHVEYLKSLANKVIEAKATGVPARKEIAALPAEMRETVREQVKVVKAIAINRQTLTEMLLDDRMLARELGQVSAAVGAGKTIAQLHGIISDNREAAKQVSDIERMDITQLKDFILNQLPQVGLNPTDVGLDLDLVSMKPKPTLN